MDLQVAVPGALREDRVVKLRPLLAWHIAGPCDPLLAGCHAATWSARSNGPAATRVDDGRFQKLTLTRGSVGNVMFEFSQLSGGTQEQVSAAFRLAMAEILAAEHDDCLPVVFDDSFVSSHPGRMRNLQRMLDLAVSRGLRVIVLSCAQGRYAALGAATVRLPEPAKTESVA